MPRMRNQERDPAVTAELKAERKARDREAYPRNLALLGVLFLVFVVVVSAIGGGDGGVSLFAVVFVLLGVGLIVAGAVVAGLRRD